MAKRFTGVCSIVLLLFIAGPALRGQAPAKRPDITVPLTAVSLLTLQCKASPVSVFVGGTVTIESQGTSLQGLPLQYSFTTTAGQLESKGSSAVLHTNGLAPQVVHVACNVADSQGRRESQGLAVTIVAAKLESGTVHFPVTNPSSTARPAPTATPSPPVENPAPRPAQPKPEPTHTESSQRETDPALPATTPVPGPPPTKGETSPLETERKGAGRTEKPGPPARVATPPNDD